MQRAHRQAHATIWLALAILLPTALAILFLGTPRLAPDVPAIRLDTAPRSDGRLR